MARGDAEYRALVEAIDHITPGCRDDARYVADEHELDAEAVTDMRRICRGCPVAAECVVYAMTAKPPAGMWAGRYYQPRQRRTPKEQGLS